MEWVRKNNKNAGNGTQTLMSSLARYEPIKSKKNETLVLGISCENKRLSYHELVLLKMLIPILELSL